MFFHTFQAIKQEKLYSKEQLEQAIEAVRNGMKTREAEEKFKVPRATIRRKIKCGDDTIAKKGPAPAVSLLEEQEIVKYFKRTANCGDPQPLKAVQERAKSILDAFPRPNRFKNNNPSAKWRISFLKRNPDLTVRRGENLSSGSSCITPQDLVGWWMDTNEQMERNNPTWLEILKDPTRIANADESGFGFNPTSSKYIFEKKARASHVSERTGSKEAASVMCTVRVF